jgi:hypothetical protein
MSIKIYNGWKLNVTQDKLFPLLWDIKKKSEGIIINNLREIYNLKLTTKTTASIHGLKVYQEIIDNVKKEGANMVCSEFDPDCNLCIYPYKGQFYARSFCDNVSRIVSGALDFLNDMEGVQEYYYFDNADLPKDISDEEWLERADVWDNIMSKDTKYIGNFVVLEICSVSVIMNSPPYWYLDFVREQTDKAKL